jgi:hypothetical protein
VRLAAAVTAGFLLSGAVAAGADEPPPPVTTTVTTTVTVEATVDGHPVGWWAARSRAWHRRAQGLRRTLEHRGTVTEALNLACAVYGQCATLWRRARCESTFNPYARNNNSSDSPMGLLQIKPSTLQTTPFAHFNLFSPYVSALAAGWMFRHGRGNEWACR